MTIQTIQDRRSEEITHSPIRPSAAEVSAALRALARAVDLHIVAVAQLADGTPQTEVSTIPLSAIVARRLWSELLAGMTVLDEPKPWRAGSLLCREATGTLLAMRVRVFGTEPAGQVAA